MEITQDSIDLTDVERHLQPIVAFSWGSADTRGPIGIAKYTVEGQIFQTSECETEEIAD